MAKIIKDGDNFLFDAEDGSDPVACVLWNEKSKATEKHPDGKPWIKLPKGNVTNRAYFSLDLFDKENVDGEIVVPVKTTGPRVLGTSGVRQDVIKYLDEETATEYTTMVDAAVEKYKTAKANTKKKKPQEMTREELEAYIECLKTGTKYTAGEAPKSFLDMFTADELERYNEILALAAENKANAPKAKRGPLSDAEKAARKAKRDANELSKAEKLLAALKAGSAETTATDDTADGTVVDEDVVDDEIVDDIDDEDIDPDDLDDFDGDDE